MRSHLNTGVLPREEELKKGSYDYLLNSFSFLKFYLLIFRERGVERERKEDRERNIFLFVYAFIGWFLYTLTRD